MANTDGASIQTAPVKMSHPIRGADTSETQIHVSYAALTGDSTGGAAIDSYNL